MSKLHANILVKLHLKVNVNSDDDIFNADFLDSGYFDDNCIVIYCFGNVDDSFEDIEIRKAFYKFPKSEMIEFFPKNIPKSILASSEASQNEYLHEEIRELLIPEFFEKTEISNPDLIETLNDSLIVLDDYICMDEKKIAIDRETLIIDSKIKKKMIKKGAANIEVIFLRTVDFLEYGNEINYESAEDALDKFLSEAELLEKYEHVGIAFF